MMRRRRRRLTAPAAIASIPVALALAGTAGVRVNTSPSMPLGLWRTSALGGPVNRGEAVTACLPERAARLAMRRHYIGPGDCPDGSMPLVKPVAAVAGDVVTVTPGGVAVNGEPIPNSAPLARDEAGRLLHAMPPGLYGVAPGTVWLLSGYDPRSFDSRYYGPIPLASVRRIAHPVLVLR